MVPFIDLKRQHDALQPHLNEAIESVINSGSFIGGEIVRQFEAELADFYSVRHAISVGNGTNGLEILIRALNLPASSEILVPAYSWISSAHAVVNAGHDPVFVDIEADSFLCSEQSFGKCISSKTKAVLPIHLYGEMYEMEKVRSFASRYGLQLIEDAAQAHNATDGKGIKPAEYSFGAVLSFYPTKQLGAMGDAGAILTNDEMLAEKCRRIANYGALFPDRDYRLAGTNSRLDTLQAAILSLKLKYLKTCTERRFGIAKRYNDKLATLDGVRLPAIFKGHGLYLYTIRTDRRDELRSFLERKGVETGLNYDYTLPETSFYRDAGQFPNANAAMQQILNLPCFPELRDEEVDYVCDMIIQFFS
jgi:dTDP-4-amino-4,6-dideoxygalactose transaminase